MKSLEKVILTLLAEIEDYIKSRTGSSYVSRDAIAAPIEEQPSGLYSTFASYLPSLSLPKPSFSVVDAKVESAKKLVVDLQALHVRSAKVHKVEDIKTILDELSQAINEQIASENKLFGVFVGPGEYDKKLDHINSIVNCLTTDTELKLLSSVAVCENRCEKLVIVSSDEHKYLPTEVISYLYSQHFAIIKNKPDTTPELIDMELFNLTNFFGGISYPNNLMMLNTLNASLNNLEKHEPSSEDDFMVKFHKQIKLFNTAVTGLLGVNKSYSHMVSKLQ